MSESGSDLLRSRYARPVGRLTGAPSPTGHRHVTLICGPPCAGKTTYVHQHRQLGDLVLDADDIARRLGSPALWDHPMEIAAQAQEVMANAMARVARMTSGTAWVIRSAPEAAERLWLARVLGAGQIIVLLPSRVVLMQRARSRPDPAGTMRVIRQWHARWQPSPCDRVIR